MKTFFTLLFIMLSHTQQVAAQALHIDSTRFITGNKCCTDIRYAIPTADKGILFVGDDNNNPGGIIPYFPTDTSENFNVLIGKIDSNQQISWIKVYGGTQDDYAPSVCQTVDGGYAVLAETESSDGNVTGYKGGNDIWLLRIDNLGNLLWEKTYGSSYDDLPISIANTPDHGFIILGTTNGSNGDVPFHYGDFFSDDWLVIKTDSTGNVQWSKDIGGTGNEQSYGSVLSVDNSYYIVSSSSSNDHDCTDSIWHSGANTGDDYYTLKLDNAGNVLWDSSYGGSSDDEINYAFYDARDNTIVVTGYTTSDDDVVTGYQGGEDMWVLKINTNGTLIWEKTLGTPNQEDGTGICTAPEGGYMAYGGATGTIGDGDAWVVSLDSNGNGIVNKIFGGTDIEKPSSIVPYLNGFAATGLSGSKVFTEGTTYGNFDTSSLNPDGGGIFVSYLEYWPLSVNNITHTKTNSIVVYPNPSQNTATILFPANGDLCILNTIGQIIYKEKKQTTYLDINTNEWANGLYIIKWQSEDGSVLTTKFIKD